MYPANRSGPSRLGSVLALLALALAATLASCGGGSDDTATPEPTPPPPAAPTSVVTGTAATGAPLPNLTVTLKDSTNKSVTATTTTGGAFTLDSSNMTPPYLLQVTTPAGARLLSVSASAEPAATINVTPLTDLLVRSWFNLSATSADTAFENPATASLPTPRQVLDIAQVLVNLLQLGINATNAPITAPADLVSKPFAADGTGIDALLDNTRVTVRSASADLNVTAGSATQATTLAYDSQASAITASSTTTNGGASTTASSTSVVPVQGGQVAAADAIRASLQSLSSVVNTKKSALAAADLEPFFAADLLDSGLNRTQYLAELVPELRQVQEASLALDRLSALDTAAGTAQARVRVVLTADGATENSTETFFFRRGSDGTWRIGGDQRIADVSVQAEGRRDQGINTPRNGPSVNIHVTTVRGTVSSVSVSSPFGSPAVQTGATEVRDSGMEFTPFFANTGPLSPPLPAAGTPVTVTVQPTTGSAVSYVTPLNAFTTELVSITSPTGNSIRAGTATVTWTLPSTYVVASIQLSALMFTQETGSNSGFQCINDGPVLAPTATTGQVAIASTCNGQPVRFVNLNLSTNGSNGERSQVIYSLTLAP